MESISIKCSKCKKEMKVFGVTESGAYKYQCDICYKIVHINRKNGEIVGGRN